MNFFGLSALFNALTSLSLGIFVYTRNKKSIVHITHGLYCFSIFIWSIFYFLWQLSTDAVSALNYSRLLMTGTIFIPIFYLHHILALFRLNKKRKLLIILSYAFGLLFLSLTFNPYFVKSVSPKLIFPFWPNPGILYHPYLLGWTAILVYILYILAKEYKISRGAKRNQLKYMLLANLIGWAGGITNYFLWYNIPVIPYTTILVSAYVIITTYAIFRHQLMDINIAIRKTAVYSILATIITAAYFILIYFMETIFRGFAGYKSVPWTLSVIVIFSIIFQPLKNFIQSFLDRYFFKGSQAVLAEQLDRAQQELKRAERLKAVGTLAAGMAHEIKNPLTGIKTFTEYLPSRHNDPEFIEKFHKVVGAEVNKINDIVQQLLDFSKPKPLKLQQYDIHKVIDQTLSFLSNDLIKYRIEAVKNYASPLLLNIDPLQMQQVFLNLFLNAIDAMKHGGKLIISTTSTANAFEITIEDTGTGMSQKDIEHIFDPFYSTKETGTGLGMSIVYGIIKEHRGDIAVESELNKGTKFKISFPN